MDLILTPRNRQKSHRGSRASKATLVIGLLGVRLCADWTRGLHLLKNICLLFSLFGFTRNSSLLETLYFSSGALAKSGEFFGHRLLAIDFSGGWVEFMCFILGNKRSGLDGILDPPVVPFYPFLGEGSRTKIDTRMWSPEVLKGSRRMRWHLGFAMFA